MSNRKVTLSGSVQWQHERLAAGCAVGYVKGVRAVINRLALNPRLTRPRSRADWKPTSGPHCCATRSSKASRSTFARTGVVAITGHVRSWAEIRQIERICWAGPAVTAGTHHLQIAN